MGRKTSDVTTLPQVRATRGTAPEAERTGHSLSYGALATLLVALIMVVGSAAAVFWEWPAISEFYVFLGHSGSKPQSQAGHQMASAQSKFSGRIPQQQSSADSPGTAVPGGQTVATQRVVLYEENPTDPQGKRYTGSVILADGNSFDQARACHRARGSRGRDNSRTQHGYDLVAAPQRRQRRAKLHDRDHFQLASGFPWRRHRNVPGILMKQSEQARGTELAGLAVKVMNGFFVIGLSADDTDAQRNEQLLKDRSWFDIPIVYTNGGRAILAMEKGPPGDRLSPRPLPPGKEINEHILLADCPRPDNE